jgi:hypothetical protein
MSGDSMLKFGSVPDWENTLPEIDYNTLNPGIRELVRRLRAKNLNTCDSGDGKTHEHECDRTYPYVSIRIGDPIDLIPMSRGLLSLLGEWGVSIQDIGIYERPCIQATYDPANNLAMIDLCYVDDTMLK